MAQPNTKLARVAWLGAWATALHFLTAGCNVVLDNEDGELYVAPPATGAEDSGELTSGDATPPQDAQGDVSISCQFSGQKVCAGACFDITDWRIGCADPSCEPCGTSHASKVDCLPRNNVVTCVPTCEPGWADCDGKQENGCEADLSKPEHCGACNTACGTLKCVTKPGPTFACEAICPPGTLDCGGQCPDPLTNAEHCNKCNNSCPSTNNGEGRCKAGSCVIACNFGYHACGGACYADDDPLHCGPSCESCAAAARPNAASACIKDQCRYACKPTTFGQSWLDCNGDLNAAISNGCETNTWNNDDACGACNVSCRASAPDAGVPDVNATDGSSPDGTVAAGLHCCHTACVSLSQTCL